MHTPTATEVETYTGNFVDLANPDPETITIADIAHHLSQQCRYTGATPRFYSIAEHAVLVAKKLAEDGHDLETQLQGLHHDDSEYVLLDVPRPLKLMFREATTLYDDLTEKMDVAIGQALGIPPTFLKNPVVKDADNWALLVEARSGLVPSRGAGWGASGHNWSIEQEELEEGHEAPAYFHGGVACQVAEQQYLELHNFLLEAITREEPNVA